MEKQLVVHRVIFYSQQDEFSFFRWLDELSPTVTYKGQLDDILIDLKDSSPSRTTLRELLGLFYRYHVEMSQLAQFESPSNREWFRNPRAFWYEQVFGEQQGNPDTHP
jgi:hypothetical protein